MKRDSDGRPRFEVGDVLFAQRLRPDTRMVSGSDIARFGRDMCPVAGVAGDEVQNIASREAYRLCDTGEAYVVETASGDGWSFTIKKLYV